MIAALLLAAGQSLRMGKSKMTLPWGERTVIEQAAVTLQQGGIERIVVVTGGHREEVEKALSNMKVQIVHNPYYENGEMLDSFRYGLNALLAMPEIAACLVALGDQPQMQVDTVSRVITAYRSQPARLIVPSYQMRRGHPWLMTRALWPEMISLQPPDTPRSFLNRHANQITYLEVDTPTILADLDTPEEYEKQKPRGSGDSAY